MTVAASDSLLSRWAALAELSAALARGVPCLQADALWGSALAAPLLPPHEFRARTFRMTVGGSIEREALLSRLEAAGYERVDTVVEVGQWSLRGGIVDIFSPTRGQPARAEFVGDEVESLRF